MNVDRGFSLIILLVMLSLITEILEVSFRALIAHKKLLSAYRAYDVEEKRVFTAISFLLSTENSHYDRQKKIHIGQSNYLYENCKYETEHSLKYGCITLQPYSNNRVQNSYEVYFKVNEDGLKKTLMLRRHR